MSEIIQILWALAVIFGFVFFCVSLLGLPGAFKRKKDRCVTVVVFAIGAALVASPFFFESQNATYAVFDKNGKFEYVAEPTASGIISQSRWNNNFSDGRRALSLHQVAVSSIFDPQTVGFVGGTNSDWIVVITYTGSNSRADLLARAKLLVEYNLFTSETFSRDDLRTPLIRKIIEDSPENAVIKAALASYPSNPVHSTQFLTEKAKLCAALVPLDAKLRAYGLQIVDVAIEYRIKVR